MPKSGFCCITMHLELYQKFESRYLELKKIHQLPDGVSSFSGYVAYKMGHHVKEKQHLRKLASKIEFVPKKFTKQITVIDVPKSGGKQQQ